LGGIFSPSSRPATLLFLQRFLSVLPPSPPLRSDVRASQDVDLFRRICAAARCVSRFIAQIAQLPCVSSDPDSLKED
jgi:hypothetical protein